jgi:hypothetical protein
MVKQIMVRGSHQKQLVCTHRVHFDLFLVYITLKISGASQLWRGLKGRDNDEETFAVCNILGAISLSRVSLLSNLNFDVVLEC